MPRLPLSQHPILHLRNKYLHHKMKKTVFPESDAVVAMNGVRFPIDLSLGKMAKSMYCGGFDFEIKRLLLKYLRPQDTFIDVGANIGYFSAVAASKIGPQGQVHAFEPVPAYFRLLQNFRDMNPGHRIVLNQCALGDRTSKTKIYENRENMGGHSILQEMVGDLTVREHEIDVLRLDDYLEANKIGSVGVIKIDTEGFELPVVLGLERFLAGADRRPIMIAELTPDSFPMLGHSLEELDRFVRRFSYQAFAICGCHPIDITTIQKQTNVVWIPR